MDATQAILIRNRIIGILVKRARLKTGRSMRECAEFLDISPNRYSRYERGEVGVSLPELEALAYLFEVPPASLWDERLELAEESPAESLPIGQLLTLRRRMLAVHFRQCRLAAGLTQKEMAQVLGCPLGTIYLYERGKRDIPLAELELVSERCGRTLAELVDDQTIPLSQAEKDRQALALLNELPPDVREFVLKPTNALYLRIAMALSVVKTDSLRQIAETILDITY
jgi:transcriptional regulator with XRE-family HTH domain